MRISIIDVTEEELNACKKTAKKDDRTLTAWARRILRRASGLPDERDEQKLGLQSQTVDRIPNHPGGIPVEPIECCICGDKPPRAVISQPAGATRLYCAMCWSGKEDLGDDEIEEAQATAIGVKPGYLKK